MCDVCQAEGKDSKFHNGNSRTETCRLYRVYQGRDALIKLCRIHSIELFCIGESRFLAGHPGLAVSLHTNESKASSDSIFAFG